MVLTCVVVIKSRSHEPVQKRNLPSSLVELLPSFQNLNRLSDLRIIRCINLETLPSLYSLDLSGCSQLRIFPDISTNISWLHLCETGIEEVPWWIEDFPRLKWLNMTEYNSLQRVSLNIFKLKHLETANFSHCGALTRADSNGDPNIDIDPEEASSSLPYDYIPQVMLSFFNCFKFDPVALLHQPSIIFKFMMLSGEEVSSYFTYRTTGISLTNIPVLHTSLSQPCFIFRACTVVVFESMSRTDYNGVNIHVNCRFKGIFGNVFDSFRQPISFKTVGDGSHLFIWDCHIPLNKANAQVNYDHVDMQLHVNAESEFKFKGWGIRLSEDCSSPENRLGNPNILPNVCEADEIDMSLHQLSFRS